MPGQNKSNPLVGLHIVLLTQTFFGLGIFFFLTGVEFFPIFYFLFLSSVTFHRLITNNVNLPGQGLSIARAIVCITSLGLLMHTLLLS
jgi:hypothetical protein